MISVQDLKMLPKMLPQTLNVVWNSPEAQELNQEISNAYLAIVNAVYSRTLHRMSGGSGLGPQSSSDEEISSDEEDVDNNVKIAIWASVYSNQIDCFNAFNRVSTGLVSFNKLVEGSLLGGESSSLGLRKDLEQFVEEKLDSAIERSHVIRRGKWIYPIDTKQIVNEICQSIRNKVSAKTI